MGDRDVTTPIHAIGGKGVFVKEVQAAVLDGRADLAVHSAKDLPAETPDGLVIAAVPARGSARDMLVGSTLATLPPEATVGTGSVRRRVQLADRRPDLRFVEIRGNIDTRLALLDASSSSASLDAIVMAEAALDRLGRSPSIVDPLDPVVVVPQVGQGALAVECRADDHELLELLGRIEDAPSRRQLDTERGFLMELGGDCDLPAGAHASPNDRGEMRCRGVLADDAGRVHRVELDGPAGPALGAAVARMLRSRLG